MGCHLCQMIPLDLHGSAVIGSWFLLPVILDRWLIELDFPWWFAFSVLRLSHLWLALLMLCHFELRLESLIWVEGRGVSYSVQNWTGPRIGEDRAWSARTWSFRSGPRSKKFPFSVFGPVPVWTGRPNKMRGMAMPLSTGWSCPTKKRVDRIKWVAQPCPTKNRGGTGNPCHFSALSMPRTGLRPVRSSVRASALIRSRSKPVRSGPGLNYTPRLKSLLRGWGKWWVKS